MPDEEIGFVYILKNKAMPDIYKIGVTGRDNLDSRINELFNGKTNIPLPFECVFACKVKNYKEVEKTIHDAFMDYRVNPNREFFTVAPERVIPILKLLQTDDVTIDIRDKIDNQTDEVEKIANKQYKSKRPKFNFLDMGIPIGSKIVFYDDNNPVEAEVISERSVRYDDKEYSLTALITELLGIDTVFHPMRYWKYNGRLLREIYNETYGELE